MIVCLVAGALSVPLGPEATLVWTHSVERTEWAEVWRATPGGLVLAEASVAGSGAGMEPPEGARREAGAWRWTPALPPLPAVVLRRSGATADWRVCTAGRCRVMGELVGADADPVRLALCNAP